MITRFENKLILELVDRTGRRFKRREILLWSTSRSWVESMVNEHEKAIFLPNLCVWCLVRFAGANVKHSAGVTFNNTGLAA